jgi:hypothetical protein
MREGIGKFGQPTGWSDDPEVDARYTEITKSIAVPDAAFQQFPKSRLH